MGDGADWVLARARGVDDVNKCGKEMRVSSLLLDRAYKDVRKQCNCNVYAL